MKLDWKKTKISPKGTHHLYENTPLYKRRFIEVLKYHSLGLAPVKDDSGAFHIDMNGQPMYPERYKKTFGFYEGLAAVEDYKGSAFHILPDGKRFYEDNYDWCGNYQSGFATVRLKSGYYSHLNSNGEPLTVEVWNYAGDFRDGRAVVQNKEGLHSHIDETGSFPYNRWFHDLGVYHKGYALAQDERGWFHIDLEGRQIYSRRFAKSEPFYNGQARVEGFEGDIFIIDETGETKRTLRDAEDQFSRVSADLVSYWKSFALKAAVELGVFQRRRVTDKEAPALLLKALWEMGYLSKRGQGYELTAKGDILNPKHSNCLSQAALTFTDPVHLSPWTRASESLRAGKSVYLTEEEADWFEILARNPRKTNIYQEAMQAYAEKDYAELADHFPGERHAKVLDAGGGRGSLLKILSNKFLDLKCVLLERSEVLEYLESEMETVEFDLFEAWPLKGDAVILARVLHDWDDKKARTILKRAHEALEPGGSLYILEMLTETNGTKGALLNLHMFLTTQGRERSLEEYRALLSEAAFELQDVKDISSISHLMIAVKRES